MRKIIVIFLCITLLSGFSYVTPGLYTINSVNYGNVIYSKYSYIKDIHVPKSSIERKLGEIQFLDAVSDLIVDPNNKEGVTSDKAIEIYKLKNYNINFRIAAKLNKNFFIFEADVNPKAKYGRDLLDIKNKVKFIGISDGPGNTEYCFIKDKKVLDKMINMILDSKINNNLISNSYAYHYLTFHLIDGTVILKLFSINSNVLDNKIMLPGEFGKYIKHAVDEFNFIKHRDYESSNADLKSLKIVLPKKWHIDTKPKVQYNFVDENVNIRGYAALCDYKNYIDFQQPNHSEKIKDEYINLPVGKCRLITMDVDNGTAASGITGTHNEYYAIIPIKRKATYLLNFTKNDKNLQTKKQFVEILMSLRVD